MIYLIFKVVHLSCESMINNTDGINEISLSQIDDARNELGHSLNLRSLCNYSRNYMAIDHSTIV